MKNKYLEDLYKFVGLMVIGLVIGGAVFALVYALLGNLSATGIHILATVLIFAVPVSWLLGLQVAKAHRAGVERGLDTKLSATERARQIVKPINSQPIKPSDDILPKVGGIHFIDAPRGQGDIVD